MGNFWVFRVPVSCSVSMLCITNRPTVTTVGWWRMISAKKFWWRIFSQRVKFDLRLHEPSCFFSEMRNILRLIMINSRQIHKITVTDLQEYLLQSVSCENVFGRVIGMFWIIFQKNNKNKVQNMQLVSKFLDAIEVVKRKRIYVWEVLPKIWSLRLSLEMLLRLLHDFHPRLSGTFEDEINFQKWNPSWNEFNIKFVEDFLTWWARRPMLSETECWDAAPIAPRFPPWIVRYIWRWDQFSEVKS